MNATQINNSLTKWSELFNDMCQGQDPDDKGHWNLKNAFDQFAKHIDGFNTIENIQANELIEQFDHLIKTSRYDKALEMENRIFHFIMTVVDK
ncbi:MAG: hypothetical protein HWE30_09855 [Methylocystaceae bacterium]|nr:hypothetical protein [Methylocystaceae bacterium]